MSTQGKALQLATATSNIPIEEYTRILRTLLESGYDINSYSGILLLAALANGRANIIRLLFAHGAMTANEHEVYMDINNEYGNAYSRGRIHTPETADLLLENTLKSPYFYTVIKPFICYQQRLEIFNNATDNKQRAELYIRCLKLPIEKANAEIQEMCARVGLRYEPQTDPHTEAHKELQRLQALLEAERAKSAERLAAATGIISKLTAL